MRSIKEIFVIGHGPSSSHTMGPAFACEHILKKYPNATKIGVTLFGSLALTGKGHLTDKIIDETLSNIPHDIHFDYKSEKDHPNTMEFDVYLKEGTIKKESIISIGGGTILTSDSKLKEKELYPHNSMKEILAYCATNSISLVDYVLKFENKNIIKYLRKVIKVMDDAHLRGIQAEGDLPGKLHVARKAKAMLENDKKTKKKNKDVAMMVSITSFAVAEENASGGIIVTAPTCGSAGVVPGVITYLRMKHIKESLIVKGLLVAGLIGILAKSNASVSGAECGCQAEIGVACAMSAALVATAFDFSNEKVAQAAEIALEHSLGLTCDPVDGYVQIPCIERCAIFAMKAINAVKLAEIIPFSEAKVTLDDSIKTMYQTGKDLRSDYKETSIGGLAKIIKC